MLELAAKMVMNGEVEAAIVVATNTFIFDSVDTEYKELDFLSLDRICYPFDERGNNYIIGLNGLRYMFEIYIQVFSRT